MADFDSYFDNNVDYPQIVGSTDILPLGEQWSYVSSTFINAFLPSMSEHILSAFLAGRYVEPDEKLRSKRFSYYDGGDSGRAPVSDSTDNYTKIELFNKLTSEPGLVMHSDLSVFGDDVLLLAKVNSMDTGKPIYWFVWCDMDVSDCCIARFVTEDDEATVVNSFKEYIKGLYSVNETHLAWPIPLHFFHGFIQF